MAEKSLLHTLARFYNIQTIFWDAFGNLIHSPAEAILEVLRILGAPVERMQDLPDALRQRQQFLYQRAIDPVLVAWNGDPLRLKLRVPSQLAAAEPRYRIVLEDGEVLEGSCHKDRDTRPAERSVEGARYVTQVVIVPEKLPLGYHRLHFEIAGLGFDSHCLSSPLQAYRAEEGSDRQWGLFCPAYALLSAQTWGAGDFSDLQGLLDFANQRGGHFVGTLPLLSAFLDEPFNPSPYAPVSRLFWNEFYLDITSIPELHRCPAAKAMIHSADVQTDLQSLRAAPLIDYRRLMALKRRVLEELLQCLMSQASERRQSFEQFAATDPVAQDYAAFRAKVERERKPWEHWQAANRDGRLEAVDYDKKNKRYHLFVQWQARQQMGALANRARAGGPSLYLDFPLGVNRDGYDVWREREVFGLNASGGAPPDGFFTKGQNWGFPPLHPEGLRQQGYRYYIECLRYHLRHAGILRIDHVMGLHRFYWIPHGFAASEGVYVRYRAEEFYAILTLESHRHQAQIVGENLGTVPPYVNASLAKHKIHGMHVSQFTISANPSNALSEVPAGNIASLDTHDTPTFAAFWNGDDIQDRMALGLLSAAESDRQRRERAASREAVAAYLRARGWLEGDETEPLAVLRAWLCYLANGDAELVLINLEDLWLEPQPQNVPGTWEERPNWKRKAQFSLEHVDRMDTVADILKKIDQVRKARR
jgi:4-alpha-glucanotransferase